ncbi:Carboxylic ester hydrolase [Mycena kentingensis (nom. inval.)]|nr:Carboxylic ester hydrolase [Mycena kentingensis (nom. inval.)]
MRVKFNGLATLPAIAVGCVDVRAALTTVTLDYGTFNGLADTGQGIVYYRGVRYADAPVGDLRWRAPVSPPSAHIGTVDASQFGANCIANTQRAVTDSTSEDCLFGNVYIPIDTEKSSGLPVLVYFHGGGFEGGSSHDAAPENIIQGSASPLIFVTFEYRLRQFGFLGGKVVKENGVGNAGLLDQKAALAWLQRYIGEFGGDPAYTGAPTRTSSAAAMGDSPSLNFIPDYDSPFIEGLYSQFVGFTSSTGLSDAATMECLRALPVNSIALAGSSVNANRTAALYPFAPFRDGVFIQQRPVEAFKSGAFARVPVLFGSNTDEGAGWSSGLRDRNANTANANANQTTVYNFLAGQFTTLTLASFQRAVDEFYPLADYGSFDRQGQQMYGEMRYICTAVLIAGAAHDWGLPAYQFHWDNPTLSSNHGAELTAFSGGTRTFDPDNTVLVDAMREWFTSFVVSGTPVAENAIDWPVRLEQYREPKNRRTQPRGAQLLLALPALIAHPPTHPQHKHALWLSLVALRKCLALPNPGQPIGRARKAPWDISSTPLDKCRAWTALAEVGITVLEGGFGDEDWIEGIEAEVHRALGKAVSWPEFRAYIQAIYHVSHPTLGKGDTTTCKTPPQTGTHDRTAPGSPACYYAHLAWTDHLLNALPYPAVPTKPTPRINASPVKMLLSASQEKALARDLVAFRAVMAPAFRCYLRDCRAAGTRYRAAGVWCTGVRRPAVYMSSPFYAVVAVHVLILGIVWYSYSAAAGAGAPEGSPGSSPTPVRVDAGEEVLESEGVVEIPLDETQPPLYIRSTHPRVLYVLGYLISAIARRDLIGRKPKRKTFVLEGLGIVEREATRELEVPRWIRADLLCELVGVRADAESIAEKTLNEAIAHTRTFGLFEGTMAPRITLLHAQLAHARGQAGRARTCYRLASKLALAAGDTAGSVSARVGEVILLLGLHARVDVEKVLEQMGHDVTAACRGLGGAMRAVGQVTEGVLTTEILTAKQHLKHALSYATEHQDNHLRALILGLISAHYLHTAGDQVGKMLATCEQLALGLGAPSKKDKGKLDTAGNAPLRQLAEEYGADMTEEIMARSYMNLNASPSASEENTSKTLSMYPLEATYGAWLVALVLESVLYGIGVVQTYLYFHWWDAETDGWSVRGPVLLVLFFETVQIVFFTASTYKRFVVHFGVVDTELIWLDSVQLLANYLTAFAVQLYFASRIWRLARKASSLFSVSRWGIYLVVFLAFTQMAAGAVQTGWTSVLGSFLELERTKACLFFVTYSQPTDRRAGNDDASNGRLPRNGMPRTQKLLRAVMLNAISRGMLTSLTSFGTMVLFVTYPRTFWFFLTLAPEYVHEQHARNTYSLNMRTYHGRKLDGSEPGTVALHTHAHGPVSDVEFVHPPPPPGLEAASPGPHSMTDISTIASSKSMCYVLGPGSEEAMGLAV